jgi:hypothetical protein
MITTGRHLLFATLFFAASVQAALVAYEDFDYAPGANLTLETANNGIGWTAAWAGTGPSGFTMSGVDSSLYFGQVPDLVVDGSTHAWSESSKANERDFITSVDLATETFYFTALVRAYGGGAATAQLRATFHDGAGASGNMRANVGIDGGTLFAAGVDDVYGAGDTAVGAFLDDTTYLLAMKRTGGPTGAIYAALIPADGNAATLAAEPAWQVQQSSASGVDLTSIRLLTNSSDPNSGKGIRIDELRIATDWDSAVDGMVFPEPVTHIAAESFDYLDETTLAGGTANGGSGWTNGWDAVSGGGLEVFNRLIYQTFAAGSTRELTAPFPLDEPDDYYFSFFARTDAGGAFQFNLKQTAGDHVRWAFARNADGSITLQGGAVSTNSAAGVFEAGKEYCVVSKFETTGDIATIKLIDPENPGAYTNEPASWDLSADGDSSLTMDRLDLLVTAGGVVIDDIALGTTYAEVIGGLLSEVPVALTPADGSSSPYAFPNFSWTEHRKQFREVGAPVDYEIQIADDALFSSVVDTDIIGMPRYVHDQPFAEGTYYWRLRSITDAGRTSAWSTVSSFTVAPHDETVTVAYDPGAADHGAAVLAARAQVAAFAGQGKSVKLIFPAGDYYFNDTSMDTLIQLDGVNHVSVEGAGAHLHFASRKQSLISSEYSTHVSVSGFKITYATGALRIQGYVTAVDAPSKTVTLSIEPGYPDFTASGSHTSDIFLLLDPTIDGRQKTGSVSFYRMVSNGYSQNPDGTWDVVLDRTSIPEWEVGDRFVFHFRSGSPVTTRFDESEAVTLHGLEIGGWGNMIIGSTHGSLISLLNIDTFYQNDKWMVGNADGVHLRGNTIGPWIEGTHIQGNGDDGIALYARPASMTSAKPGGEQNAAVFRLDHFNLEPGNEVAFFEPLIGTILLETRVVSVVNQDGTYLVHFENDLPEGMNFTGELVDITQVWNRSKSCGDFMIRNGKMTNNRRYAIVQRARRGIIENMEVRGASSRSIHFANETAFPNGLYPSEIIVRNNVIQDSGFVAGYATPLRFLFSGKDSSAQSIGPRNLLIEDQTFADCGTPEIGMNDTRNAVIRNNRTHAGSGVFTASGWTASDSVAIEYAYDDGTGDTVPPAAPSGLTAVAGPGRISLDWRRGSDGDVAYFKVYRSSFEGGPYTVLASHLLESDYVDESAAPGATWYYVVAAFDLAHNKSLYSGEASATALETDPPTPFPAQFSVPPTAVSGVAIHMTAAVGSDAHGPVEYYFEETSGNLGGSDSGWQLSPDYTDTGLAQGTSYAYAVRMRDALLNTGSSSAPLGATTWTATGSATLNPVADSFVWGGAFANNNYGTSTTLACKTDAANEQNTRHAYLRYDLSSITGDVVSATLRMKVASLNGSGDMHTVHAVAEDAWGETTITWNNKPPAGPALDAANHPAVGEWLELDVTAQVAAERAAAGLFSAALISDGTVLATYHSREAVAGNRPELVVQTRPNGYNAWAEQYGLIYGPDGHDDDDGLANIYEYGVGGDPTNGLDLGYAIEFWIEGTNAVYVHPRLSDPYSGIRYYLELTDNLVSNLWTTNGYSVAGTFPDGYTNGLDAVTNLISTEGMTEQFIRLRVEEE